MRTKVQLINKKKELEFWLQHNQNHVNRTLIESDLREVNHELANYKANV
jgi:hypothetical protein